MKIRSIILGALLASSSTVVLAQQAPVEDKSVVMRRPLPHKRASIVTPTPETPNENGNIYGWYVTCSDPIPVDCEKITPLPGGEFDYEVVALENCMVEQSAEKNGIVEAAGNLPPGLNYDWEAMCHQEPEPPLPPVGTIAYGYTANCNPPQIVCHRMEVTSTSGGLSTNSSIVDFSQCQVDQGEDAANVISRFGYKLGQAGANSNAAAYCQNASFVYGYAGNCDYNYATGQQVPSTRCIGIEVPAPATGGVSWVPFPDGKCEEPQTPAQLAQARDFGFYNHKQEAYEEAQQWCGAPSTPTPTPTPTPSGPEDGLEIDNDWVSEGQNPPWSVYDPHWEVGEWQGQAVCGEEGTINRNVYCMATGPCTPKPGHDLCGPGDYPDPVVVPSSYCEGQTMPRTTYTGAAANCGYELSYIYGDWENMGDAGDETCSDNARRERIPMCRTADGNDVNLSYCRYNLQNGGSEQNISNVEWGNYAGCTYHSSERTSGSTCNEAAATAVVTSADCYRSDGAWVANSYCPDIAGKTFPYTKQTGTCSRRFDLTDRSGYATTCAGSDVEMLYQGDFPSYAAAQEYAITNCTARGDRCCQITYGDVGVGADGRPYAIFGSPTPNLISWNNNFYYEEYGEELHASTYDWHLDTETPTPSPSGPN